MIAFILLTVILFIVPCFYICEVEYVMNIPHDDFAAVGNIPASALWDMSAGIYGAFMHVIPDTSRNKWNKYEALAERRVFTLVTYIISRVFVLCGLVCFVARQLYDAFAIRKRRLPVLAISSGGNSPPIYAAS